MLSVGRRSGDIRCDIADEEQLESLWDRAGSIDAVVCTAGEVRYAPLRDLSGADFTAGWAQKALSQINLVRTGLGRVSPTGSFTLTSGVPSRDPVVSSSAAATANGAIEAFVRAAALEIAPQRINVVSPSVLTESLDAFGDYFPGFVPVQAAEVARGYLKAVEGAATGQTVALP